MYLPPVYAIIQMANSLTPMIWDTWEKRVSCTLLLKGTTFKQNKSISVFQTNFNVQTEFANRKFKFRRLSHLKIENSHATFPQKLDYIEMIFQISFDEMLQISISDNFQKKSHQVCLNRN
jgi:hypothetical protein